MLDFNGSEEDGSFGLLVEMKKIPDLEDRIGSRSFFLQETRAKKGRKVRLSSIPISF